MIIQKSQFAAIIIFGLSLCHTAGISVDTFLVITQDNPVH
jgi:hypothetical protein